MNKELSPFGNTNLPAKQTTAMVAVESSRAIQEVQAALIIAKKFPRDQMEAYTRIMKACERKSLAESATYAYPRGGQTVTGPSIRLAETAAQNWGNLQFGIRELSQENGESEVEAFAWDVETNTRQVKVFKVPHVRHTKSGKKSLTDPRDIYEMVANQGSRRLRACILGIIPGDVIEAAVQKCDETLKADGGKPLVDRIRELLVMFEKFGITKEMIEKRLKHSIDATIEREGIELNKIKNSIRDGMSKREDWFDVPAAHSSPESEDLTAKLKAGAAKELKPEPGNWWEDRKHWQYVRDRIDLTVEEHLDDLKEAAEEIQQEVFNKWIKYSHAADGFPISGLAVPNDIDPPQEGMTVEQMESELKAAQEGGHDGLIEAMMTMNVTKLPDSAEDMIELYNEFKRQ